MVNTNGGEEVGRVGVWTERWAQHEEGKVTKVCSCGRVGEQVRYVGRRACVRACVSACVCVCACAGGRAVCVFFVSRFVVMVPVR